MPEQSEPKEPDRRRRVDLSVAQVAASALAAVVGAVLASELGVYGTIIGAAVVSVGATTGGAVFHHLFRRTGEQLREVTERGPAVEVNDLQQVPLTDTAPMPAAWLPQAQRRAGGEWNDSPVLKAGRRRSWKTYGALSGVVFLLAMTPIVIVELASGKSMHAITTGQDGGGSSVVPGRGSKPDQAPPEQPSGSRSPSAPARSSPSAPTSPSAGASAPAAGSSSPSGSPSSSAGAPAGSPSTTPSPTPAPTLTPSATATGASAPASGSASL